MSFRLNRLRNSDWMIAVGAIGLLVLLIFFKWFEVRVPKLFSAFVSSAGYSTSFTGWHTLTQARWILLLAILAALVLVAFKMSGRTPAPALCWGALALAALATLLVFYRTVLNQPGGSAVHSKLGAYLALAACAVLTYGLFAALTQREAAQGGVVAPEDAALAP